MPAPRLIALADRPADQAKFGPFLAVKKTLADLAEREKGIAQRDRHEQALGLRDTIARGRA